MREVLKAVSYIISEEDILAISQPLSPEVGYLLPSGTVEPGELPANAALREAQEETGLVGLKLGRSLGVVRYDMRPIRREVQVRHFFEVESVTNTARNWNHYEAHPSAGGEPIPFQLIWLPLKSVASATFSVGHGQLLPSRTPRGEEMRHSSTTALFNKARAGRLKRTQAFAEALAAAEVNVPPPSSETPVTTQAMIAQIFCQLSVCTQINDVSGLDQIDSRARAVCAAPLDARVLTVSASECTRYDLDTFDSPIFIVNGPAVTSGVELSGKSLRVETALRALSELGYREYVDSIGICCIVEHCDRLEPNRSYTLSATPGTVYVSDIDSQVRMMEQLLHESIHNWLNDAMYALNEKWNDEREWWSPWKNEKRPTYGMLHAAYVFAILVDFFQTCCDDHKLSDFDRAYAAERLVSESNVLVSVIDTLPEVLDIIQDRVLRMFISLKLNTSLNIAIGVLQSAQR